jgi:hypothetical protein
MTLAKDLIMHESYNLPGHSEAYELVYKEFFDDQDENSSRTSSGSNCIYLVFKHPDREARIYKTVDQNEQFNSECCGCVVSGGKKTRRKMKKRKPRKSRKARKSARKSRR